MRPKVAFFDFTCCEGCQLTVLSCEEELLDLLGRIEIVNFREAMSEKGEDYEIAFVEGSITRKSEIPRLQKIRRQAEVVVALGSCATLAGINALKNRFSSEQVREWVYGRGKEYFDTIPARPLAEIIPVDYSLVQCPLDKGEFLELIKCLLLQKKFTLPNNPVCVDCKFAENQCVYERGMTCLGLVTLGGCSAICVTYGSKCWGCRGMIKEPNINSQKDVLQKYGLKLEEVINSFNLYGGRREERSKGNRGRRERKI